MGCVESHSDLQTNIFNVVNENGHRQRSSRLEVTDTHIIFHQRGRAAISWPLRCLRRYGFDAEQFSFESGRRCPTGPGIYDFKCRRAEALFNILQIQIQNIAEDTYSRDVIYLPHNSDFREMPYPDSHGYIHYPNFDGVITTPPPSAPSSGVNGGIGGISTFPNIGGIRSAGSPPAPISPPAASLFGNSDAREIQNTRLDDRDDPPSTPRNDNLFHPPGEPSIPTEASRSVFMSPLDKTVHYNNNNERPPSYSSSGSDRPVSLTNHLDRSSLSSQSERPLSYYKFDSAKGGGTFSFLNPGYVKVDDPMKCRHPVYINVDTDFRRDCEHVYENTGLDKDLAIAPPRTTLLPGSGGSGSSHSGTTTTTDTDQHNSKINYTLVELDKGSDSSQTAPLTPPGSVASVVSEFNGYVQIDFPKTEALHKAAAMWETRGEASRRTRHNFNYAPIPSLGRHNSTMSD